MTLFDIKPVKITKKTEKKPKLGRYERILKDSHNDKDPYKVFIDVEYKTPSKKIFNFVDLFSGAGGMSLGFTQAGFNPVANVELIDIASATHKRNFPNCKSFCGDIADFNSAEWLGENKDIHLVVGGPPCQGFSVAGKRDPNDPRNNLFKEFVRVVNELKPWYVVMENVPGIITMKGGKVKEKILESFAEIGYPNMSVSILESAQYKIPQLRPRAIFVANRFGLSNPFPKPQLNSSNYLPIESAISDLPAYSTIPEINHEWTKHSKEFMKRISKVLPGESLYETFADAFKRQYPGLPSMTIKENHGGTHIHPYLNRVISAREMARLQSFPDSFIFEGTMKKAMWQIGNAVPPRLAKCIGLGFISFLEAIYNNNITSIKEVSNVQINFQLSLF